MKYNLFKLYKNLNKKRKKIIVKSMIFSLFLLGINTYAWFIFFDKFDGNINANVIGWDISFYDEDTLMDSFALNVGNLYPGMPTFNKTVLITNDSDVKATFSYELVSFTLFGIQYLVDEENTSEVLLNDLQNSFPFKIVFNKNKEDLNSGGDNAIFSIDVIWDFESSSEYYKLNNYFEYDNTLTYYIYNGTSYIIDDTVTSTNIASKVISGLYIESDEADSYWGKKAYQFSESNATEDCLKLDLNLIVSQVN
ncbi:MAG: hypothetical protein PHN42_06160 [Bacilli bacterium]|nr:hypothetical protein [Bacilli bacterium]